MLTLQHVIKHKKGSGIFYNRAENTADRAPTTLLNH